MERVSWKHKKETVKELDPDELIEEKIIKCLLEEIVP